MPGLCLQGWPDSGGAQKVGGGSHAAPPCILKAHVLVGPRRADRSPGSRRRAAGPDRQLWGVSVAEAGEGEDGAAPCAREEAGGAAAKQGGFSLLLSADMY